MKFCFDFSDGKVITGTSTPQEEEALILFCAVQKSSPEKYLQDVFDAAVKTAVLSIDLAGGVDVVRDLLYRQGE